MFKYTASEIINYAKSLADLQDVSFITWGDAVRMLNIAYKKVYQDIINNGDLNYLDEVEILQNGKQSLYELPDNFYQLAMVVDEYGVEIPKLRLSYGPADMGFLIKNNTIYFQNVDRLVKIKYYPEPDQITYKQKQADIRVYQISALHAAFDKSAFVTKDNSLCIMNIADQTYSNFSSAIDASDVIMGANGTILKTSTGVIYDSNGNAIDNVINPMLTTSGFFVQNTTESGFGYCNDDASVRFMVSNGHVYCNGNEIADNLGIFGNNIYSGRVIYYNGRWALITNKYIIFEDGSWETTDVPYAKCILKADTDTGFGYISLNTFTNSLTFQIISDIHIYGWAPETVVNFPNNILFEIAAYDLAIQFRNKQFADATPLKEVYNKLEETYWKTLPQDQNDYVTIRNVNKSYTRWRMFV